MRCTSAGGSVSYAHLAYFFAMVRRCCSGFLPITVKMACSCSMLSSKWGGCGSYSCASTVTIMCVTGRRAMWGFKKGNLLCRVAICIDSPCPEQATSSFTLWELGFNFNYTKALMRLLRNRRVLAAMPSATKTELALKLLNCSHGPLASNTHHLGRADMNKLAKEAFICLAESCTRSELSRVRGYSKMHTVSTDDFYLPPVVIAPLWSFASLSHWSSPHLTPSCKQS